MTGRQLIACVLAVAAVVLGLAGGVAHHVRGQIVERRTFAERALEALDRAPVRFAVEQEITAQVLGRVPSGIVPRAQVRRVVDRAVGTRAFRRAFRRSALDANRVLFDAGGGSAQLRLGDIVAALDAIDPRLGTLLAGDASQRLLTLRTGSLGVGTRRIADVADTLARFAPPLALVALVAALLLASDRRRVLRLTAICTLIAGALLLLMLSLGRSLALDRVQAGTGVTVAEARDAAGAVWDVYAGGLRPWAFGAIVAGLLVAVVTLIPGSSRRAARSDH
jgi:hypothetical protein